jgi:hypothetical protein
VAKKPKPKPKARKSKALEPKKTRVKKNPRQPTTGRPTKYSPQLGAAICAKIVEGFTLRQIDALAEMPCKTTILYWLAEREEFLNQYARARETWALAQEDEIIEIADDSRNDWVEREGRDGEVFIALNDDHIKRARARIEARKWLMSKRAPKVFGDRVAVTGPNGGPVQHQHSVGAVLEEIDGAGTCLPPPKHDRGQG